MNDELTALINQAKIAEAKNKLKTDDQEGSQCNECQSSETFYDDIINMIICMKCGADRKVLLLNNDQKYYDSDQPTSDRCSNPINKYFPKSSMETTIVGGKGTSSNYLIKRLHSQHNRIPYREKKRNETLNYIRTKCHDKLPQAVIDDAVEIVVNYVETSGKRSNNRVGMIMAAIQKACEDRGVPRSAQEIAAIFNESKTVLTKGNKLLTTALREQGYQFNCNIFNANDYLSRYCSKLDIIRYKQIIMKIFNLIKEHKLIEDNNDNSLMAASILTISYRYNLNVSRANISEHCKVSQVTIYKCYKKLKEHKETIVALLIKYEKKKINSEAESVPELVDNI
jgi:transcription initiation factor TFIIB